MAGSGGTSPPRPWEWRITRSLSSGRPKRWLLRPARLCAQALQAKLFPLKLFPLEADGDLRDFGPRRRDRYRLAVAAGDQGDVLGNPDRLGDGLKFGGFSGRDGGKAAAGVLGGLLPRARDRSA